MSGEIKKPDESRSNYYHTLSLISRDGGSDNHFEAFVKVYKNGKVFYFPVSRSEIAAGDMSDGLSVQLARNEVLAFAFSRVEWRLYGPTTAGWKPTGERKLIGSFGDTARPGVAPGGLDD